MYELHVAHRPSSSHAFVFKRERNNGKAGTFRNKKCGSWYRENFMRVTQKQDPLVTYGGVSSKESFSTAH